MGRATTPSFIAEFPLRTSERDEAVIEKRLEAARQLYNACLGEALRRLDLMRESRDWQRACALPATLGRDAEGKPIPNLERRALFREIKERFGFTKASVQRFALACRDACWIGHHLASHDNQTVSLRAFLAVEQHMFGKRGRPRFKGKGRLRSIEGKTNAAVIRFDGSHVHWRGLALPILRDPRDRDEWQKHALARRTKYCRILRRVIRGRARYHVQLIQDGLPPRRERRTLGSDVVGLDLGPSTIAAVSEQDAVLERFCASLEQPWRRLRRIERAMDRSRRVTNPDNYEADGRVKKGVKRWQRSSRYLKLAAMRRETERRLAAERGRSHGELANRVLAQGVNLNLERVSYRSFQRCFGRSVKVRAPGLFVSKLCRKAVSAGGTIALVNTRATRLSQYCHQATTYRRKTLSERWHIFPDGSRVQRDLYAAWLARFVRKDRLDTSRLEASWATAEPLLRRAVSGLDQSATGHGFPLSNAPRRVRADRPPKARGRIDEAGDGVALAARAPESRPNDPPRTPGL